MDFEPWMLLIFPLFFGMGWLAARFDIKARRKTLRSKEKEATVLLATMSFRAARTAV